jgi:hypothetical protein
MISKSFGIVWGSGPREEMLVESTEVEAKLVVLSENPGSIADQIADLSSIAFYRMVNPGSELICDLYFDTPGSALDTQGLALRVREAGDRCMLAIKGPSKMIGKSSLERLEIEKPWSYEALAEVVEEFIPGCIETLKHLPGLDHYDPPGTMEALGLVVIQNRETWRRTRSIVMDKEGGPAIAELAVDSVVYHIMDHDLRHHEVEVEASPGGGFTVVEEIAEYLIQMYGAVLKRWNHDKLVTGRAIEELMLKGELEGMLDGGQNLKPSAYERINECLR